MKNAITPAFLKKHPNFTVPQVGMDFTVSYGSDCYAWRIVKVDEDCKGFFAQAYRPINKAVWPVQDWQFEDENGNPRLCGEPIHCKYFYGHWIKDQDSRYFGEVRERINPHFGSRCYYQDPSF